MEFMFGVIVGSCITAGGFAVGFFLGRSKKPEQMGGSADENGARTEDEKKAQKLEEQFEAMQNYKGERVSDGAEHEEA